MSLRAFCGIPGSGKTLDCTDIAIKHYKKQNNRIKYYLSFILSKLGSNKMKVNYEYYKLFPYRRINNVYTNYPVLLDKKRNIYSRTCSIWDLDNRYSFYPESLIIIDEVQIYVDSDEYKDKEVNYKIGKIGKFLQAHRHFGIKEIIFVSQHPSRIFKKGRNICESYLKHNKVINIPLIPYSIISGIGYYEQDFYGRFIPRDREERKKLPFDYYKYFKIINRKVVYNSYDSRYLSNYNYNKPLINKGGYSDLKISFEILDKLFNS